MPVAGLDRAGLPGLPSLGVGDLVAGAVGRLLSAAVHSFAASAFSALSSALLQTTAVPSGVGLDGPWRAMVAVAGLFAVPILLVGVTSELLAGRPVQAVRRGVALPLLVGPVLLAARAVLGLLDAVVRTACGLLVQTGAGGPQGFAEGLDRMRADVGVATGVADPTGTASSLVVVLVAGLLVFVIWVELAVRAALLLLLTAFVPLALAGMFWSATAGWTRRLLESLGAVLLAPLVITMVMVLATATLTAPAAGVAGGIDHTAIGLGLLFLGTLGLPLTFRVIPHVVDAAVVTGAGAAVARRAQRGAGQLTSAASAGTAARLSAAPTQAWGRGSPSGPGPAAAASRVAAPTVPSTSAASSPWTPPPAGAGSTPLRAPGRPGGAASGSARHGGLS